MFGSGGPSVRTDPDLRDVKTKKNKRRTVASAPVLSADQRRGLPTGEGEHHSSETPPSLLRFLFSFSLLSLRCMTGLFLGVIKGKVQYLSGGDSIDRSQSLKPKKHTLNLNPQRLGSLTLF
jgi:hypothetical protein